MRSRSWIWIAVAAIIGALLPAPILSHDAHAHFPWMVAWMMVAPVTALVAVGMFLTGRYFYRRAQSR
jgi:hypothetical protein